MSAVPAPDTSQDAGAVWHHGDPLGEQRAAAGAAVVVWFASKRWKAGSLVGAMVILGVATNYAPIRERITSIVDQGASRERSLIWSTAIEIISEHPAGVPRKLWEWMAWSQKVLFSGATVGKALIPLCWEDADPPVLGRR